MFKLLYFKSVSVLRLLLSRRMLLFVLFASFIYLHAHAQTGSGYKLNDTAANKKLIRSFYETQASVRYIYQCAINKKGAAVAWCADAENGQSIFIKSLKDTNNMLRITAATATIQCNETEPAWSPDDKQIAFLSDAQTPNQLQIFIADAASGKLITSHPLTNFNGYVSHLQWSPDGKMLSVLYVEKATRNPSPMAAENRSTGVIDSIVNSNVQRVYLINIGSGENKYITPAQTYIFEYGWAPNSKAIAYTAALPPGDDNWYIAKLFKQNIYADTPVLLYTPKMQVAVPRWSFDGKHIAFIEGLMSDEGGTGGEIFMMDTLPQSVPVNLTPHYASTPAWLTWQKNGDILFSEFTGGSVAISSLNITSLKTETLWKGDFDIRASNEETSISFAENNDKTFALIKSGWNNLPEVWAGNFKKQVQLTTINKNIQKPFLRTENVSWLNDGNHVQGWLLFPANYDSTKKYPMLVCVHGGPAWIATPAWAAPDFNTTVYTQFGYFVFFPNARGSYGEGENFTLQNRKDWGFGDLRDILSGIDTIVSRYSVDSDRLGILGWSYGGSMAMISVTQTNRFKAAVAGAGACNWISYYGENSIDKWMLSYFGKSPYEDPEAYRKVSALTYINQVKTPALVLVGERDGESPSPQSFEFWHALKELKVPTQLVVYPDEGHEFENFNNMIDVCARTLEWFNIYLKH